MFNKWYEWLFTQRDISSGMGASNSIEDSTISSNSVLGRKRPRTSILDSLEPENSNAKRFCLGDLVDTVKVAAGEVKEKTSTVMTWMRSKSPSLSSVLSSLPVQLMRPTIDHSPSQMIQNLLNRPMSQDGSVTCAARDPIKQQQYHCKVVTELFKFDRSPPQEDTSLLFRRPSIPREMQNKKENSKTVAVPDAEALGRSLRLEAWKSESGTLKAVAGKQNHQMYKSVYEKTFPIISAKRSHSCRGALSPRKSKGRHCSTAEETIRHEEKELYKQLLQMVTNNQLPGSQAVSPISVPQSHLDLTRFSISPCLFRKIPSVDEQSSESLGNSLESFPTNACTVELFPCLTESPCRLESDTISGSSISSAQHDPLLSLDTQSTASDSDSVIVIKVKDAPVQESTSFPCLHAEQWIKELTSMYDSRARQRQKRIEEQEALALRLQKQRLEDQEPRKDCSVELKLRVPLEKEIPATIREEESKKEDKRREEEEFPELTDKMEAEVQKAFNSGNQDEVLSDAFRLTITRKDIHTLKNLNWLNDEIINFYMNMLVDRSTNKMQPKVHAFNTFFYPRLKSAGFQAVKRWTKKVDIFAVDILLVPVHLGVHWCLAVVDFRKKSIEYYDSMGGSGDAACSLLMQYLKQESLDKKGKPFDTNSWKLSSKDSQEIPQQMNGSDCGMFACKYADYITRDWPITFSQKHMPYFRKRMVWEILHQKLL